MTDGCGDTRAVEFDRHAVESGAARPIPLADEEHGIHHSTSLCPTAAQTTFGATVTSVLARPIHTESSAPSMIALLPGPTELSVGRGIQKRKRPSAPALVEEESHRSTSRRKCGQIKAQAEQRVQTAGSRESAASGRSSARSVKTPVCNRGSSRVQELEEQLDIALQAKQELVAEIKEHKINFAQSNLKQLEDYFTCPL